MRDDVLAAFKRYLSAGVYGGALVWAIEAVDRAATLWPSFNSAFEPFIFAVYLIPSILLGLAVGVVMTATLVAVRLVYLGISRSLKGLPERWAPWVSGTATVLVLGGALRFVTALAHESVEAPMYKLARKIDGKLVSIDFVVAHFSMLFFVGLFVVVAGVLIADVVLSARETSTRRWPRVAGAVVFALATGVLYALDSRFLYGRYESVIHIPATAGALVCGFVAGAFALGAVAASQRGRRIAAVGALGVLTLGVVGFALDLALVGSNQNLKALLWRRGVVARRAYQIATTFWDRDKDGFSPLFGGGDLDDADPNVNPLADEIPGNGVDDNCFGGDPASNAIAQIRPVSLGAPLSPTRGLGAGKDFLFIAIDTLRANRMSVYGYSRPTSTRLAEWAERGVFFERPYSEGTNTGQTFASMNRSRSRGELYDGGATMFRRLLDAGYQTAQVNARRDDTWLDGGLWTDYRKILLDGVETVTHTDGKPLWDADKVTDHAIKYLSSVDPSARHATWVHYLDPHAPRRKMAPFDFGNSDGDKYDTEVAFADREVGRLLDWMQQTGRLQNTIVVLMADHGEGFGEHGMVQHGNRPYDEQSHVPLIVWAPGVAPARVATPVSTLDIAPTVLSYLGVTPIADAEGIDLLSGNLPDRPIFVETPRNGVDVTFFAYSVTSGDWRLIYDVVGSTIELYNLKDDPLELHNRADSERAKLAELKTVMASWLDSTASVRPLTADEDTGGE